MALGVAPRARFLWGVKIYLLIVATVVAIADSPSLCCYFCSVEISDKLCCETSNRLVEASTAYPRYLSLDSQDSIASGCRLSEIM